jgi:hypothetical protein
MGQKGLETRGRLLDATLDLVESMPARRWGQLSARSAGPGTKHASQLITPDFAAMGWAHPAEDAALWNGLVVEAALLELAAVRRLPRVREALARYLQPPPAAVRR